MVDNISPDDCLWGDEFFDTYMKHATKKSYFNKRLHQVAALALIGQPLRNVRLRSDQTYIDCRIHPFIMQSSGSGKNSIYNLTKTIARQAGFEFDVHGKDSTAGIIGTVQRNGESKAGDLKGNGFVAWKEAQQLIKAAESQHSSDLMEVINQALDPSGRVSRSLAGGDLEYPSRTSLFCTTYPPDPQEHNQLDLINQGFLPRTLFVYRDWDEEKYDMVNEKRDENLPRPGDDMDPYIDEFEEDIKALGRTLRYIEDAVFKFGKVATEGDKLFSQGKEHIRYFKVDNGVSIDPSDVVNEVLSGEGYRIRKIAKPFKTRLYDLNYKISACLAAVDKDEEQDIYVSRIIKDKHVRNAKKMVKFSFKCIVNFIKDYMTYSRNEHLDKVEKSIKYISMNDSGMASVSEVMRDTRSTKNEVKRDIRTLNEIGVVESDKPISALEGDDKVRWVDDPGELR